MAPAVFNDRSEFKPDLLWRLFRQAVEEEPQIEPKLFRDVLEIKFVAIVKLTHTLCLINAFVFFQYMSGWPTTTTRRPRERVRQRGHGSGSTVEQPLRPGRRDVQLLPRNSGGW